MSRQLLSVKLTFQHLHCHLHDRLGAAQSVGRALHHLPKGSRAQDTTWERQEDTGSVIRLEKTKELYKHGRAHKHVHFGCLCFPICDSFNGCISLWSLGQTNLLPANPYCPGQISLAQPHFKDRVRRPDRNITAGRLQRRPTPACSISTLIRTDDSPSTSLSRGNSHLES